MKSPTSRGCPTSTATPSPPLARRIGTEARDDRFDDAVFDAADVDAALDARVGFRVGLSIGRVEDVVAVDEHSARPAELLPLREEISVRSKTWTRLLLRSPTNTRPLESVAMAWGVSNSPGRALLAPGFDELSVLRELHDPRVGLAAVSVGDEDIAVGSRRDGRRPVEGVRPGSGDSRLAERQQDFPSGLNFTTWWPLPSLPSASATQTLPSLSTCMP